MEDSRLCFRCYGCSNLSKRRISFYVHKYGLYTRFELTRRNEVDERLSTFMGIYTYRVIVVPPIMFAAQRSLL